MGEALRGAESLTLPEGEGGDETEGGRPVAVGRRGEGEAVGVLVMCGVAVGVPGAGEGQGCAVADWLALPEPVPVPRSAHDGLRAGVGVGLPPSPPVPVGLALAVARMLLLVDGLALRVAPADSLAAALLLAQSLMLRSGEALPPPAAAAAPPPGLPDVTALFEAETVPLAPPAMLSLACAEGVKLVLAQPLAEALVVVVAQVEASPLALAPPQAVPGRPPVALALALGARGVPLALPVPPLPALPLLLTLGEALLLGVPRRAVPLALGEREGSRCVSLGEGEGLPPTAAVAVAAPGEAVPGCALRVAGREEGLPRAEAVPACAVAEPRSWEGEEMCEALGKAEALPPPPPPAAAVPEAEGEGEAVSAACVGVGAAPVAVGGEEGEAAWPVADTEALGEVLRVKRWALGVPARPLGDSEALPEAVPATCREGVAQGVG